MAGVANIAEDTTKVKVLCSISYSYHNVNTDSGFTYGERAHALAAKLQWPAGIALADLRLGINYYMRGNGPAAIGCTFNAARIFDSLHDQRNRCDALSMLCLNYYHTGELKRARYYDSLSMAVASVSGDRQALQRHLHFLVLTSWGKNELRAKYARQSIELARELDLPEDVATKLSDLGDCYMENSDSGYGLRYQLEAVKMYRELGQNPGPILNSIVLVYLNLIKKKQVVPYDTLVSADQGENMRKAIYYIKSSIDESRKVRNLAWLQNGYSSLGYVLFLSGRYKEAYEAHLVSDTYGDSVTSLDVKLKKAVAEVQNESKLKEKQMQINDLSMKQRRNERTGFIAGVLMLALISVGAYRNYRDQKSANKIQRQLLAQKDVLMKEVHHRVKNNLQVILTLLDLQLENIGDTTARKAVAEGMGRINSISLIHQQLYRDDDISTIEFSGFTADLLAQVTAAFRKPGQVIRLNSAIPPTSLDIDTAIPLGLVLNELITNSYKYAFPGDTSGDINISLQQATGEYTLQYSDSGPGLPPGYKIGSGTSLGMMVVDNLSRQLGGSFKYDITRKAFIITFKDEAGRRKVA